MVDRTALEMRSTRKCTGGSNPSLSATFYEILIYFDVLVRKRVENS